MPPPAAVAFRAGFLLLCCLALPAFAAEVRITLPLDGYYRPGRYMPVRVEVRGGTPGTVLRLTGDGMIPTDLAMPNGRSEGTAPVLSLENRLRALHWTLGDRAGDVQTPLRPLDAEQRLVGFTGTLDRDLAGRLFPQSAVVPVPIDPQDLTRAEPGAWQALDAIVVEAALLTADQIRSLAAAGVTVVMNPGGPPQTTEDWPWRPIDGRRVLRHEPLGPTRAGVSPAALAPVQAWQAEFPRAHRNRLLLYGVLLVLLMLGAALLRGRVGVALIIIVSLSATLALNRWWRATSPALERIGGVFVLSGDGASQRDAWSYRTAGAHVEGEEEWYAITWPFFEQIDDLRAMDLHLECGEDGRPIRFRYRLSPGRRLALLTRAVAFGDTDLPASVPGESEMHRLARRLYLRPGYSIAGVLPTIPQRAGLLTESYRITVIRADPADL